MTYWKDKKMIMAKIRISDDIEKTIINFPFESMEDAKYWSTNNIGKKINNTGLVEYVLLTDYKTMETREYEMREI